MSTSNHLPGCPSESDFQPPFLFLLMTSPGFMPAAVSCAKARGGGSEVAILPRKTPEYGFSSLSS